MDNSRQSTQENTIQTNETTDTVVPDTTGQVLQSSPIANQLSNNSRQSTQENTIQTNETTDTVVPDTTGQVLQSSPIANQLSNNSRQSTQENTIQTNETTEEQPSASSMTTRSQMRYLAFAKQFQSGDTENTEENTTISERVRRQYAKKRLQLLEKLKNQWGIQDDTDYSEVFQSVMDSLQPVENEVKDPGVLVDLFVQYLPVTANLIALQAIDQFIRLFPKNMQTYLQNVKIAEYVSIYPNTYNYLEELDEYGKGPFTYTFLPIQDSQNGYIVYNLYQNFKTISMSYPL
ncbi:attachment subunit-related family [Trichomonas vaginalis G3]|uniref:attachment subunit-related family n=1 Tax=Trichomonas vaginalis (strain ATCC PRA-98 / G3) TaxID=412133 RepID=UPI0021E53797|nr:attachment subunit-related family [Trichomonas vaginalis G3]KAI5527783.1 attachment subunit-related family [Trichomonas vaginalis G3]